MPFLKELYDNKDASFIAGIGVLTRPVNRYNYLAKTKTTLFDHIDSEYFVLAVIFPNLLLHLTSPITCSGI